MATTNRTAKTPKLEWGEDHIELLIKICGLARSSKDGIAKLKDFRKTHLSDLVREGMVEASDADAAVVMPTLAGSKLARHACVWLGEGRDWSTYKVPKETPNPGGGGWFGMQAFMASQLRQALVQTAGGIEKLAQQLNLPVAMLVEVAGGERDFDEALMRMPWHTTGISIRELVYG